MRAAMGAAMGAHVMAAGAVGILAVFLAVQFKAVRGEYALYLILAAGVLIMAGSAAQLLELRTLWEELMQEIPVDSVYVEVLLKMLGIAYMAQFCAGLCRDAGYGGLASQIETFGKLAVLVMGLPVVSALLTALRGFLYEGIA